MRLGLRRSGVSERSLSGTTFPILYVLDLVMRYPLDPRERVLVGYSLNGRLQPRCAILMMIHEMY
jgi:hypothetical protein